MSKKKPPEHFDVGTPPKNVLAFPSKIKPPLTPQQVELGDDNEFLSVIDMLELLLEDLYATPEAELPTGIFVGMYKNGKDFEHFPYYNHGLTRLELLGLLTQYMRSVL